ncbi:MAG TPA: hypothetical protein VE057_07830 [Archangium sp.]|nr:hypothetical protein [Archangium sp.]
MPIPPARARSTSSPAPPPPAAKSAASPGAAKAPTRAPRQVADGYDAGRAGTAGAQGVNKVNNASYRQALDTQRRLSGLRQEAGRLQLGLDNRGLFAITGGGPATKARIAQLKRDIAALEKVERAQPRDAVGHARFTVFNERIATLERELGKGGAATIARQTYYNSEAWNVGAGSWPASEAKVLAAGLPRGPDYSANQAVGGYRGTMLTPDGREVDMGHVAAALDWQVNAARVPDSYLTPTLPPHRVPNPFTLDTVALTGDVASAVRNTANGNNVARRAAAAIAKEGDADWNGDIDGLNLANRLQRNPNMSITQALNGYYGTGQYQRRIDEFATHSRYIQRDANGRPQRDAQGDYAVNRDLLAFEAHGFSLLLDPRSINNPAREVADAWVRWFKAQH